MASHRIMAGSAKLMARNLKFARSGKGKGRLRDFPRHSFEAVVRAEKTQHMHGIGAGNSKLDGNTRRDRDALRDENKLLRDHAHGNRSSRVFRQAQITLHEFPPQVQGCRVGAFTAAKKMRSEERR